MKGFGASWHSYPKVHALGHRYVKDIFKSEVVIQEKIDGSQISFGMINGQLRIKSKSVELVIDAPDKMFSLAVERIKAVEHLLTPGWTYRGEYLKKPCHNALTYATTPLNNIIIFDINVGHEEYLDIELLKDNCEKLRFECVPNFFRGIIENPMDIPEMIKKTSYLGDVDMEGVVIKNYNMFGEDKKILMAKYVCESFKEINNAAQRKVNPSKGDIIQFIIASLRNEARWLKVIQHLKESGALDHSPKDIGLLMKELDKDIREECEDFIKEELYKWAFPTIIRGARSGFPEWYKQYLIEETYKEDKTHDIQPSV